jgi:hypothetical protein
MEVRVGFESLPALFCRLISKARNGATVNERRKIWIA